MFAVVMITWQHRVNVQLSTISVPFAIVLNLISNSIHLWRAQTDTMLAFRLQSELSTSTIEIQGVYIIGWFIFVGHILLLNK